jgi:hypothetical protein
MGSGRDIQHLNVTFSFQFAPMRPTRCLWRQISLLEIRNVACRDLTRLSMNSSLRLC